jgi:hypothetical protein
MAKNVVINGSSYNAVPYVQIPLAGGGGNATFYETSDATAAAANVLTGFSAYGASGKVNGQLTVPTITQDSTTKVLTIS